MKKHPRFVSAQTPLGRIGQLLLLAAVAAVLIWGAIHLVPYLCPVRWGLGILCPGCGMTRAAEALLHLDFAAAWQENPLVYLLLLYAAGYGCIWVCTARLPHLRLAGWIFCGCFLAFWAVRFGWFLLGEYPEFYQPNALLPRILRLLSGG